MAPAAILCSSRKVSHVTELSREKGEFRLLQMTKNLLKITLTKKHVSFISIPRSSYVPTKKMASVFVSQSDPLNLSLQKETECPRTAS
jgi:hypothetical protein